MLTMCFNTRFGVSHYVSGNSLSHLYNQRALKGLGRSDDSPSLKTELVQILSSCLLGRNKFLNKFLPYFFISQSWVHRALLAQHWKGKAKKNICLSYGHLSELKQFTLTVCLGINSLLSELLLHNSKENYTQFNFSVPLSLIFYYNYLRGRLAWQNSYPVNNDLLCIEVMSHMVRQQGHKERDEEFTFTEGLFSYAADT